MKQTHLVPSAYRMMPWKNGGGSTTEVAIFPPHATMHEPFLWRVSLAHLRGSGPFSSFPAYERHIVQLSGAPMRLKHAALKEIELLPLTPYQFQGEWASEAILSGEAQDFNLMLRRDAVSGELETYQFSGDATADLELLAADAMLVYVWQGSCKLGTFELRAGDSLLIEEAPGLSFPLLTRLATIVVVNLSYKLESSKT